MLGGPGGRAAWEAMQPKRKKSERCGLYFRESLERCRWCGNLDEHGLSELKEKIQRQHRPNKSLGRIFFIITAIIAVMVVLI